MSASETASDVGRIRTETRGHVRLIGIDRPTKLNGFTPEMLDQLAAAYQAFEADDNAWCGLLWAEGKHFTAGLQLDRFDITAALSGEGTIDPLGLRGTPRRKPLVVAVQGICFTIGIELMLAADIVVAGKSTRFAQMEVRRGLMAYGGATLRMVERAGWGNAMRWLLTGEEFTAAEAHRIGFVQEVVDDDAVFEQGLTLATKIASAAPLAVEATIRSAREAVERGPAAAIGLLDQQMAALARSEDFAEGVRSFRERREGVYRRR